MRSLPYYLLVVALAACSDSATPDASADATQDLVSADGPIASDGPQQDAGASDGPMQDAASSDTNPCVPGPPANTVQLLDQVLSDLGSLSGAARQTRVDQFWADLAQVEYPLRNGSTVALVLQAATTISYAVPGSFNGWSTSAEMLTHVPETDLHYIKWDPPAGRQEYKFYNTDDSSWFRDQKNRHVIWDGIPTGTLGDFNSTIPDFAANDGRLEWYSVTSPQFQHQRDVFVYLPPGYGADLCKQYPSLYVHDGNESITRGEFDTKATQVFQAGGAEPAVMIFVALASQNDRLDEYNASNSTKAPQYSNFLCDTLVPFIDGNYRTEANPDRRGLAGASLGGLISFAAAYWRNDCFHLAASQSGTFWYENDDMILRVQNDPAVTLLRSYLDNGTDNLAANHQMRDALIAKGYNNVFHWENLNQQHTWGAWYDRFDELLAHTFPPATP